MKRNYQIIGVMSGTSLDGIDLVHATITPDNWDFKIHNAKTIAYSEVWKKRLKEGINFSKNKLKTLDEEYTAFLSEVILKFINDYSINHIDAVCSHGHTILHQPEVGITLQIGNLPFISSKINKRVVCDFRVQDVELDGQGAPLVPIGDKLLFKDYDYCLNLGGFANVSFQRGDKRIAFDICPVNIVMNHYCKSIGLEYDNKGKLASTGKIDQNLLNDLNRLIYYTLNPPKSLGLEWVNKHIFPLIKTYSISVEDVLRTFVEHVSIQISKSIKEKGTILVTGGGAYNTFLISRIKANTESIVIIPSQEVIEYKEALIFGLLGVLKLRNEVNCLRSVTGAIRDHSSGKIFLP